MPGFRTPLRNDFDRIKQRLEITAKGRQPESAAARAMLAFVPVFLDLIEFERDRGTPPAYVMHAITTVIANMTVNGIKAAVQERDHTVAAEILVADVLTVVLPRLRQETPSAIINPSQWTQ